MTSITIYDGADTIGGSKIYLEEKGHGLFLDFGMNFKKYGSFFQEYLSPRPARGLYDLLQLDLIPKLNIYRKDLIPSDVNISLFPSLNLEAILLSHAHMDHFGNIGLLDPKYPVIASPCTISLLKGILDCSTTKLETEAAYFSIRIPCDDDRVIKSAPAKQGKDVGRNFICVDDFSDELCQFLSTPVKITKPFEVGTICHLDEIPLEYEIKAFEVDHSIYGATSYLIYGDTTTAYTGDFRLHGKRGYKTEEFIKQAKDASILIIEGTRAYKSDYNESEEIVFENCLGVVDDSKDLVVADFSPRNFERLEIFNAIAEKTGRSLVITTKDAYLLKALETYDGINRINDALIFNELKTKPHNWEKNVLFKESDIEFIDSSYISKEQAKYIVCFSLYDIKHLLDIKPEHATYIYSSSEAFEEESEFDFIRLNHWLKHFGFDIYGFEVKEEHGKLKPEFMKGFHASGHASGSDLIRAIETIDPDYIIPVHTENPNWFKEQFNNVCLCKEGEKITL